MPVDSILMCALSEANQRDLTLPITLGSLFGVYVFCALLLSGMTIVTELTTRARAEERAGVARPALSPDLGQMAGDLMSLALLRG